MSRFVHFFSLMCAQKSRSQINETNKHRKVLKIIIVLYYYKRAGGVSLYYGKIYALAGCRVFYAENLFRAIVGWQKEVKKCQHRDLGDVTSAKLNFKGYNLRDFLHLFKDSRTKNVKKEISSEQTKKKSYKLFYILFLP